MYFLVHMDKNPIGVIKARNSSEVFKAVNKKYPVRKSNDSKCSEIDMWRVYNIPTCVLFFIDRNNISTRGITFFSRDGGESCTMHGREFTKIDGVSQIIYLLGGRYNLLFGDKKSLEEKIKEKSSCEEVMKDLMVMDRHVKVAQRSWRNNNYFKAICHFRAASDIDEHLPETDLGVRSMYKTAYLLVGDIDDQLP